MSYSWILSCSQRSFSPLLRSPDIKRRCGWAEQRFYKGLSSTTSTGTLHHRQRHTAGTDATCLLLEETNYTTPKEWGFRRCNGLSTECFAAVRLQSRSQGVISSRLKGLRGTYPGHPTRLCAWKANVQNCHDDDGTPIISSTRTGPRAY